MRDHSIVTPEFWTGRTGKSLRAYPAAVRELAFYLFSAPAHEMWGLYYCPVATMSMETGREEISIRSSLSILVELGYCAYDDEADWVWVIEMAQIQLRLPMMPGDYKVRAANKWYQHMPKNRHLGPYWERYCDALRLLPPKRSYESVSACERAVLEGAVAISPKPLTSGSGSGSGSRLDVPVALELVLEPDPIVGGRNRKEARLERFNKFWRIYPKRVGKKLAKEQWDITDPDDDLTDRICAAVLRHRTSYRWTRDGGVAIPDPCRYIKHERWADEQLDSAVPSLAKQTLQNIQKPGAFLEGFRE